MTVVTRKSKFDKHSLVSIFVNWSIFCDILNSGVIKMIIRTACCRPWAGTWSRWSVISGIDFPSIPGPLCSVTSCAPEAWLSRFCSPTRISGCRFPPCSRVRGGSASAPCSGAWSRPIFASLCLSAYRWSRDLPSCWAFLRTSTLDRSSGCSKLSPSHRESLTSLKNKGKNGTL